MTKATNLKMAIPTIKAKVTPTAISAQGGRKEKRTCKYSTNSINLLPDMIDHIKECNGNKKTEAQSKKRMDSGRQERPESQKNFNCRY